MRYSWEEMWASSGRGEECEGGVWACGAARCGGTVGRSAVGGGGGTGAMTLAGLRLGAGQIGGMTCRDGVGNRISVGILVCGVGVGVGVGEIELLEENVGDETCVCAIADGGSLMRRFVEVVAYEDKTCYVRQNRYKKTARTYQHLRLASERLIGVLWRVAWWHSGWLCSKTTNLRTRSGMENQRANECRVHDSYRYTRMAARSPRQTE